MEPRRATSQKRHEIHERGFQRQVSLAYDFSNVLVEEGVLAGANDRVRNTLALCFSITEIANALVHLLGHSPTFLTAAYMLGRGLVENSINYCFLLHCNDDEFNSWVSYSRQKAYRRLDRTQKAGDAKVQLRFTGTPDPADIPGLLEDLAKFTGPKGGERTRWTDLAIEDRLAEISEHGRDNQHIVLMLSCALLLTYEIGSEALHGTLLGAGFPVGLFATPNETPLSQASSLQMAATICLSAMLRIGAREAGLNCISEASRTNWDVTLRLLGKSLESGDPSEGDSGLSPGKSPGFSASITPGPSAG